MKEMGHEIQPPVFGMLLITCELLFLLVLEENEEIDGLKKIWNNPFVRHVKI